MVGILTGEGFSKEHVVVGLMMSVSLVISLGLWDVIEVYNFAKLSFKGI